MRSKLATTRRIVESAAALFHAQGFSAVSMDQIASTAEITKMTVYQHFRSKEELLLECLRWRMEKREAALNEHFRNSGDVAIQIVELFDWMSERADAGAYAGCAFLKSVNETGTMLPEVRAIAMQAKRALRDRITKMLRSARVPNAEHLGRTLALLLEGAQAMSVIEQSKQPFKVASGVAKDLIEAQVSVAN